MDNVKQNVLSYRQKRILQRTRHNSTLVNDNRKCLKSLDKKSMFSELEQKLSLLCFVCFFKERFLDNKHLYMISHIRYMDNSSV